MEARVSFLLSFIVVHISCLTKLMYRVAFVVALLILAPLHGYTEAFGSGYFLRLALRNCVVHHSCYVSPCGLCI